jgi:hypothetical protein
MGVQKDAGELLLFFYDEIINKGKDQVGTRKVLDSTEWESSRLNNAYNYLNDMEILKQEMFLGNTEGAINFVVLRVYPAGINVVENQPSFKATFGFEVNLGLLKFSWSRAKQ